MKVESAHCDALNDYVALHSTVHVGVAVRKRCGVLSKRCPVKLTIDEVTVAVLIRGAVVEVEL